MRTYQQASQWLRQREDACLQKYVRMLQCVLLLLTAKGNEWYECILPVRR